MKIHAICSYNGKNYSGWQKQINENSIQSEIEKVLSKIFNSEINIQGSGRTDAGVHALHQHFHFEVKNKDNLDVNRLQHSMNSMLPRDIKILSLEIVDDDFHARFSAIGKEYIYKILRKAKDPFNEGMVCFYPQDLDLDLFEKALQLFVGTNCYQDFTSKEEDDDNFVRTISEIKVSKENNDLSILLKANGFMRYEIRFIIGAALAVASKDIDISFINEHLNPNKKREIIHYKAPADGLYLSEVYYK